MSTMSTFLDKRRQDDLRGDPDYVAAQTHYDALHVALKAKHGTRKYKLGSTAAMKLEPTSEPAEVDDVIASMLLQISDAETALQMARDALEGFGKYPSTLTARSLMNEAIQYLQED